MTILTCDDDGHTFDVLTERISGWDAITYRQTMGEHLEAAVATLLGKQPHIVMAVDRTIVRWLWVRQNEDATATIASVALLVHAIPSVEGGEDGTEERQDDE